MRLQSPHQRHPKISVNANINAGFAGRIGRMMEAQGSERRSMLARRKPTRARSP
jgi:hypothetical protein